MPPRDERGMEVVARFFLELTATMTSSAPSELNIDQPSSLNPLMASLNPLQYRNGLIRYMYMFFGIGNSKEHKISTSQSHTT